MYACVYYNMKSSFNVLLIKNLHLVGIMNVGNKKLLTNKDVNAASKLQIYKSIIRPTVTYGCETWAMTVTEQNHLMFFERRILRKIYGPTLDNDGTWRTKTNEEVEMLVKKKKYCKIYKIKTITLGSACKPNGHNKNC